MADKEKDKQPGQRPSGANIAAIMTLSGQPKERVDEYLQMRTAVDAGNSMIKEGLTLFEDGVLGTAVGALNSVEKVLEQRMNLDAFQMAVNDVRKDPGLFRKSMAQRKKEGGKVGEMAKLLEIVFSPFIGK